MTENPTSAGGWQPAAVHAAPRKRSRERVAVDRDGAAHLRLGGFRAGDGNHHHIRRDHSTGTACIYFVYVIGGAKRRQRRFLCQGFLLAVPSSGR